MYVKDESLAWVIRPGYGDDGKFPFTYEDSKGQKNKIPAGEMVAPGDLFFAKAPMANRFKLLGSEVRKEMNKQTNIEMEVTDRADRGPAAQQKGDDLRVSFAIVG